jgi:enoyl-CoA hydratase
MSFDLLQIDRDGAVAVITLNRPAALNALNRQLLTELSAALAQLGAADDVRVVVVTGAGDRAFVAGADISEIAALDAEAARRFAEAGQALFRALETLGKPSIAAINGFALGGGCELAMACTLRIAAEQAQLGQPEIDLGTIPGFGGTQRLVRLVGRGRALAMLLSGQRVSAVEAERIGLVNKVVPAEALRAEAMGMARSLAAKPPAAVRYILKAVHEGADLTLEAAQALEASLFGLAAATADMKEGTAAFLEKRKPTFGGR